MLCWFLPYKMWISYKYTDIWASLVAQWRNAPARAGDSDLTPGLGRSPGEGNDNHYSILAWEIPWTEEPGRLQSMRSKRVGHKFILYVWLCSCPTSRFNSTIKLELLFLTHFAESERLVLKHELYRISVCTFLTIFLKLSEPWFLYLQNDSANNSYFIRLLKEKMAKVTEHLA